MNEKEKNGNQNKDNKISNFAVWLPIGVGLGVSYGVVFDNLAIGIPIGLCFGVAIGVALDAKAKKK